MDNREIRIQSEGQEPLEMAVALLWANCPGAKTSHYSIVKPSLEPRSFMVEGHDPRPDPEKLVQGVRAATLVLFWHKPERWDFGKVQNRKISLRRAKGFVAEWLWSQPENTWDEHLSDACFDGSLGQGFLAFNEEWGHVGNSGYAFAAFRPICSWYGK